MMHITYVHLTITPQSGRISASQPLAHYTAGIDPSYNMHTQIPVLRNNAVPIVKRHRCTNSRRLVSLCRVDPTNDPPL